MASFQFNEHGIGMRRVPLSERDLFEELQKSEFDPGERRKASYMLFTCKSNFSGSWTEGSEAPSSRVVSPCGLSPAPALKLLLESE